MKKVVEDDMHFDLAVFMLGKTVLSYDGMTLWQKTGQTHSVFEHPHGSTAIDKIEGDEPFFFTGTAGISNKRDRHHESTTNWYPLSKKASSYRTIWLEIVSSKGRKGWICASHLSPTPPVRFGLQKADFVFRRMLAVTFDTKGAILCEQNADPR